MAEMVEEEPPRGGAARPNLFGDVPIPAEIRESLRMRPKPTKPVKYNVKEADFWQLRYLPAVHCPRAHCGSPGDGCRAGLGDRVTGGRSLGATKGAGGKYRRREEEGPEVFQVKEKLHSHMPSRSGGHLSRTRQGGPPSWRVQMVSSWRLRCPLAESSSQEGGARGAWHEPRRGKEDRRRERKPSWRRSTWGWTTFERLGALGKPEEAIRFEGSVCWRHGAAQYRGRGRFQTGCVSGWSWRPCGRLHLAGGQDPTDDPCEDGGHQSGLRDRGEAEEEPGQILSSGSVEPGKGPSGQEEKEEEKVSEQIQGKKRQKEKEEELESRLQRRSGLRGVVQQRVTSPSSEEKGNEDSRLSLQNVRRTCHAEVSSGRYPGGESGQLRQHGTAGKFHTFFLLCLKPQMDPKSRDTKELFLLSRSLDLLRQGQLEQLADALASRMMAVETASKQGWGTAKYLEVLDEGDETSAPAHVLLAAQRHGRLVEKAGGKGSWTRQQANWYGEMSYGQQTKGKAKDGKGKGKKGKPKGKGKQTWGSWQEEKPKGGDAGAPRKEAEK